MTAPDQWQPTLDLDLDMDDGGLPTFTVRELGEAINGALRRGFYEGVWVRGEIQGLSERNGHLYFTLADDGEEGKATVAVNFFANVRFKLRPLLQRHHLRLADGLKVRIHGYPDFYAPSGRLSLKMSGIDPRYTLGELALQRDDLVRRLVAEGLYDAQARLAMPALPLRVGVVTSLGSAAWHDVIDELTASGHPFHVTACDVRVQGAGAAEMIAAGLRTLGRLARPGALDRSGPQGRGREVSGLDAPGLDAPAPAGSALDVPALDVIVLVRGGGSRADLASFDAETVARAIAGCPVPVLTGLGHELDRSVADELAHLSLKTPTACAAELVRLVRAFDHASAAAWAGIVAASAATLDRQQRRLGERAERARRDTGTALAHAEAGLGSQRQRLVISGGRTVTAAADRLQRLGARLQTEGRHRVRAASRWADATEARVAALDPARTLARGWSITRRADGTLVRRAEEVRAGDELVTTLGGGTVHSRVEEGQDDD